MSRHVLCTLWHDLVSLTIADFGLSDVCDVCDVFSFFRGAVGAIGAIDIVVDVFISPRTEVQGFDLGKEFPLMMKSEGGSGYEVVLVTITYVGRSVLLPQLVAEMGLDRTMGNAAWMMWSNGIINTAEEAWKIINHHFLVEQRGSDRISHLKCEQCSCGS
jgi:hypothetical protein